MVSGILRSSRAASHLWAVPLAALTLLPIAVARAQESSTEAPATGASEAESSIEIVEPTSPLPENVETDIETVEPVEPGTVRPLAGDRSILSMEGGRRLLAEAEAAINGNDYESASEKLQQARQVFNQLSNFYQDLSASFSGIDNRIAEDERRRAAAAAQMRDEATYQLALLHRTQEQPELAVPLLIQILRSQQPTRELGEKAYRQLLELGFVEVPYPRASGDG